MQPSNKEIIDFCNNWVGIGLTKEWHDCKQEFLEACATINTYKPKNRPYQVVLIGPEIIIPKKGTKKVPQEYGDDYTGYIRFLPAVAKFDERYRVVGVFKY